MSKKLDPLSYKVVNGEIIIRMGIDTLAYCTQFLDDFKPYDDEAGDWVEKFRVSDSLEFAKDVVSEMSREEEDGSTPLTDFLDKVCINALDNGSIGIEIIGED